MLDLMKNAIHSGKYGFRDLQERIARLYAMGNISETELDELMNLAVEQASPDAERPELLALIQSLSSKVDALTDRLKALESRDADDDAGNGYPAWESWDGLSDKYQPGSVVSHKDQLWQSVFHGQNVWEPGTVGTQFWLKYAPEV